MYTFVIAKTVRFVKMYTFLAIFHQWSSQAFTTSVAIFMPYKCVLISGGQSTQIKYLSKSTDTYNKILLH